MRITGGKVFDPEKGFVERDLGFEDGVITESTGGEEISAKGCYVIPGLVDLHFHGCVGEDFSDASKEGLAKMAEYELSQGVAYICPAGMTLSEEQLTKICENAKAHREANTPGAELVGINLEGPFLSAAKKGAQNGAYLRDPDAAMLERLQKASGGLVRLVTIAPELPGTKEFIEKAKELGVTVSIGHTAADYDTASAAYAAGARQATHLYNAMPPFTHRAPGVIGAAFDCPEAKVELICDGLHIHGSVVRATFKLFGADRMILISDTMQAAGMPDGEYSLGGLPVTVRGNRASLTDAPDTIAGSVTNLMACMRQAVKFGIPLADAVRAASTNPAKVLGLEKRLGSLDAGKDATILLLDENDLSLKTVIFKGKTL